ncbi:MAG: xanthan lyase [Paludibacter sp.]|nr:xanthan lyase [Paludibacter sp.]
MKQKLILGLCFIMGLLNLHALPVLRSPEQRIADSLTIIANSSVSSERINKIKISFNKTKDTITVTAGDNLGYLPFRKENVNRIYSALYSIFSGTYPKATIKVKAYDKLIEELIPNYFRETQDSSRLFVNQPLASPLITKLSVPYSISKGLAGNNIALWNSHGRYFDQQLQKWIWQRPRLFLTVEDLLTTSFVIPFLTPMLENAGAQVFIPRERDIQTNEVVVDNDDKTSSRYRESNDMFSWKKLKTGFSNAKEFYLYKENPFQMGTSRQIKTTTDESETSSAEWIPDIPEKGTYAVYVSYQTVDNSAEDAHYTVYHSGGKTEFVVNQTIYGGTWLYLGHFKFDKGRKNGGKVVLTNFSKDGNKIITADAVKIGGGMGNIAGKSLLRTPPYDTIPVTSNFPRYAEGARYWLQWAGVPDSVYSRTRNINEYSDDFQSRGYWVNYLAGGSSVIPGINGLRIPLDMAFAFHSDAGITSNDSVIGTLGICTVNNNKGNDVFYNGVSRWTSRDMVDLIQTQIVDDIRKTFRSNWTRRGIWNKSYSESRVPEVPTMLLEILSHQNFEDMKLALDPRFRFTVSRAIYKGMLKHLSLTNGRDYVVQPLPVEQFSCIFTEGNKVRLTWKAVSDTLEPSAEAERFIVYTRIDDGGFDNGRIADTNSIELTIVPGKIYSFKVTALNEGGESFPSEILSVSKSYHHKDVVLIVNGFERISGPEHFNLGTLAGFMTDKDAGVPYLYDISFTGQQSEFSLKALYKGNDNQGFGASGTEYEDKIIAGNTFDYPYVHGKAIQSAGYSFVSASVKSVIEGDIKLHNFDAVDLILGKQKQTMSGNVKKTPDFKTFPLDLQHKLKEYCADEGKLMVSGQYIVSDICTTKDSNDIAFINDVLKIKNIQKDTLVLNSLIFDRQMTGISGVSGNIEFFNKPNDKMYFVEKPGILIPADEKALPYCYYEGSDLPAGIVYKGKFRTCTFGFPFETIKEEDSRNKLMRNVLKFFFSK